MIYNVGPTEIDELFKNKYPLLMIDFINELEPGVSAKDYKLFSNNEWFFPVHFEDNPNVPGTVMLDMFVKSIVSLPECKGKETADVKVNNLLFKRKIRLGERLDIACNVASFRRGLVSGNAVCTVKNEITCSCDITICVSDLMIQINAGN